jgi:hypothetical protein
MTGAFSTMLWPYVYVGLETKQSFFVLLAGYLGLADGDIKNRWRLLGFAISCGLAMTSKSVGIVLAPAMAYLIYAQFRNNWRSRRKQALMVVCVAGAIWALGTIGWNLFWGPKGGGLYFLQLWAIDNPFQFFSNFIGLFGSPTKGLFVFAPALLLSLYAMPRVFREHRDIAVFALLVTACTAAFISVLATTADELWGPRFLHVTIAPLLLCMGAAWPRLEWRRQIALLLLAAIGLPISFLGAFFYYGSRDWAAERSGQNTLEWFAGDGVWNEVAFDARLFRVWLRPGTDPVPWTATHVWVWEAAQDSPPWRTVNLRDYATPQSYLLFNWNESLDGIALTNWRILGISLILGPLLLISVLIRAVIDRPNSVGVLYERPRWLRWASVVVLSAGLVWAFLPLIYKPHLVLNKKEVIAGNDSYVLKIGQMPNTTIAVRYSIDDSAPEEFTTQLDSHGEARFDVGAGTRKGLYRMIAFRQTDKKVWKDANVSITVK